MEFEQLRQENEQLSNLLQNTSIQLTLIKDRNMKDKEQYLQIIDRKDAECRKLIVSIKRLEAFRANLAQQKLYLARNSDPFNRR